ncbi:hypothetical protein [Acinetobacter shaoyimingii]|uniref:Lipoprotein n=1 Tax=Acinetobacter shaoyimingii TaxID=2715164 RepID=A0A6G8RWI8_9GAMM|nr:hypothetical protein [Acinetobacter shaoyimingii]QIO06210.1 hypothetical protein G8E00_09690 [Acinetobacter shaoyimingii]
MLKIIITSGFLLSLIGCSSLPSEQENMDTYLKNQSIRENTANMSEFEKQRYYSEHHLGPIPAQPNYKKNRQ